MILSSEVLTIVDVYRVAWEALPPSFQERLLSMGLFTPESVISPETVRSMVEHWRHSKTTLPKEEQEAYLAFLEEYLKGVKDLQNSKRYREQLAQAQGLVLRS